MKKIFFALVLISTLLTACKNKETTNMQVSDGKPAAIERFDIKKYKEVLKDTFAEYETPGGTAVNMLEGDGYYLQQECPKAQDDMVCLQKMFYKDNLTLQTKGRYLKKGDAAVGVWEYYDRAGKLIKQENRDAGYKILWADMAQILKKQNINLKYAAGIYKYTDNNIPYWKIMLTTETSIADCTFNGLTGALVSKNVQDLNKIQRIM